MLELFASVVLLVNSPDYQLRRAILLSREGAYEASEKILKRVKPLETSHSEIHQFYRLFNNFSMNNKKEAFYYAEFLYHFSTELPERHKVVTYLMYDELQRWQKDDLADIARDFGHIKERLKNKDLGKKTQDLQAEALAKLDKIIKEMEDKANSKDKGDDASSADGSQNQQPLPDSGIDNTGGDGKVAMVKVRKLVEEWGRLPPKEQQQALQKLTEFLSPKHKEAIENYFRKMAKTEK